MKKTLLNVKKRLLSGAIFSLLLLLSGSFVQEATAQTTVQVGTEAGTTSLTPIFSCYDYSYSQQIYTAAEMIAAGSSQGGLISKVRFYYSSNNYGTSNSTGWTVYMGNTMKTAFNSNTDWVGIGNLTNSFSGTVSFPSNDNWLEITLTTPFIWDGVSNIVVGVDQNKSGFDCSIFWGKSNIGPNRSIYYRADNNNPDPASPPAAYAIENAVANVQFEVTPFADCAGMPASANIISALGSSFCENDDFQLTIDQNYMMNGMTYQWQEFDGVGYTDILNDTLSVSSISATSNTSYQVIVGCSVTGDEITLAPFAVTVNPAPTVVVDYAEVATCPFDAATITASGATTYAWAPATGLTSSNTAVVNAFPPSTTTYTVTGTDANGCTATATSKVIPYAEVKPNISINPTENCTPGSPIVSTVEEAPANSNAGVWNYRFLEEDGTTIAQDWSTS